MTLTFNPNIATAPVYVAGASIETIQQQYGLTEVIKLASNENPLGPSPLAVAAMQEAIGGLNRYPAVGDDDLRAVLAEVLGRGLQPDNFFTGNGASDILAMLATAFLTPGDECVICRPTFPVYESTARRIGAAVVYADLDPENYTYDVETILAAISGRTRLLYLCSPNNPTGTIITAEQMETLVNNLPHFFQSLNDGPLAGVSYVSACGVNPALFNFSALSFPMIFEKVIPENLYPDEMKKGKGDGLVSAESSIIPWSGEQYYFDCNHAEILFDKEARDTFIHAIELMCL